MADPSEPEALEPQLIPQPSVGIYVDSSALAKLYVPEPESDRLDGFLRGRRDLMISELALTEVLSAIARRSREGSLSDAAAFEIRDALMADADGGSFSRLDLSPNIHREAERLLLGTSSIHLRTLDALHVALAMSGGATHLITFDHRMRTAATQAGLRTIAL